MKAPGSFQSRLPAQVRRLQGCLYKKVQRPGWNFPPSGQCSSNRGGLQASSTCLGLPTLGGDGDHTLKSQSQDHNHGKSPRVRITAMGRVSESPLLHWLWPGFPGLPEWPLWGRGGVIPAYLPCLSLPSQKGLLLPSPGQQENRRCPSPGTSTLPQQGWAHRMLRRRSTCLPSACTVLAEGNMVANPKGHQAGTEPGGQGGALGQGAWNCPGHSHFLAV